MISVDFCQIVPFFQAYKKKLFSIFSHEIIISHIFIKFSTRNKYNPFDIQIFIFEKNWKTDYKTWPLSNYSFFQGYNKKLFSRSFDEIIISYIYIINTLLEISVIPSKFKYLFPKKIYIYKMRKSAQ